MKKMSFLLLLAGMLSLRVMGQESTIELTFTANYSAEYVQLDSINVTNETQGVDTVLYYPDTVLILDYGVGIPGDKNQGSGFRIDQNYPNPVTDQTTIGIYIPEQENVSITVTDIQGRPLLTSEMNLIRGNHTFRFMPGKGNMVFFTATW
ncbi:MAG: T9SS type A sorting domain-containing protein, partial [Bacteroidota bacterium]